MGVLKSIYQKILEPSWCLGVVENDISAILNGEPLRVKWVKDTLLGKRWFADPHILNVTNDSIDLLVEKYNFGDKNATIARITIDIETMRIIDEASILALETHLSFPAIKRLPDEIFIYPENSQSGELNLYKYERKDDKVTKVKRLCDRPLTDAVMYDYNDEKYIFSTESSDGNGNVLGIYKYLSSCDNYVKEDEYVFCDSIARGAGDIFMIEDEAYRPAQDCNSGYGRGISIQKIIYKDRKWRFEEVRRLYSPHPIFNLGMHTLSVYGKTIVVDVKGYRRPRTSRFLSLIREKLYY